jgi:hypothetical protein
MNFGDQTILRIRIGCHKRLLTQNAEINHGPADSEWSVAESACRTNRVAEIRSAVVG